MPFSTKRVFLGCTVEQRSEKALLVVLNCEPYDSFWVPKSVVHEVPEDVRQLQIESPVKPPTGIYVDAWWWEHKAKELEA